MPYLANSRLTVQGSKGLISTVLSLLWGCIVYSCLSCLRLSSTSPAIEPSSPLPPADPLRKHILPASGSTSPPSSQMERSGR